MREVIHIKFQEFYGFEAIASSQFIKLASSWILTADHE